MSQDGAGQSGGRGGAWPAEQLPVGVVGVQGVDGVDGVLLESAQVFVEADAAVVVEPVAATNAVVAAAHAVVAVGLRGGTPLGDVSHVGAARPPQGGLAAGRGHRLAVGAAVAAGCRPFHRRHSDGGDGLRVWVEGGREGDGGAEGCVGGDRAGVEVIHARMVGIVGVEVIHTGMIGVVGDEVIHTGVIGVVGVEAGVLEVVGVVGV